MSKNKPTNFTSIIWGYHKQLAKLSPLENYHLHDLKVAMDLGYKTEAMMIVSSAKIEDDANFPLGRITVNYYHNIGQYLLFLWRHRQNIIYANTFTWHSLISPLICRRAIFMGHDSVIRKTRLKQLLQDISFHLFSRIRVISAEEKDFLIQRGVKAEKIFVVPLTIDVSQFSSLQTDLARHNLIFLGNVTEDKNSPDILRALAIVKKKINDIKLEVVGEVRDPAFDKLCAELNLKDNIIVHGFISHDQLLPYLLKTKVYVNSSLSEGQCLAAYEAALAGNALCLPSTMSFRGVFKDKALFHDLFASESLAQNILSYLENEEKRRQHVSICQTFIRENYNPELIYNKTKKLFLYD